MGNDRGSRDANHTWSFTVTDLEPLATTQVRPVPVRQRTADEDEKTTVAKPAGVPTTDTFITEVSQDTWIHFPWDLEAQYSTPIAEIKTVL